MSATTVVEPLLFSGGPCNHLASNLEIELEAARYWRVPNLDDVVSSFCPSCSFRIEVVRPAREFRGICPQCGHGFRLISPPVLPSGSQSIFAKRCEHGRRGAVDNPALCDECAYAIEVENLRALGLARVHAVERERIESEQARQQAEREQQVRSEAFLASVDPFKLEEICISLFRKLGYQVRSTPRTGDHGADGILEKNGTTTILQVKRTNQPAGPRILRELLGTLPHFSAQRGILISTGGITRPAAEWAKGKPLEVWDLPRLRHRVSERFTLEELISFSPTPPVRRNSGRRHRL